MQNSFDIQSVQFCLNLIRNPFHSVGVKNESNESNLILSSSLEMDNNRVRKVCLFVCLFFRQLKLKYEREIFLEPS